MSTTLTFEKQLMKVSTWNEGASIPFISKCNILQNTLLSSLDRDDPACIGYGKVSTTYPYTQQNVYTRQLKDEYIDVVRLENDYLKAIFIPSLGGRLWSLYDKVAKRELLYVNDVIRPSNLAVRNAWVSGGVEWNIGIIGHSPFTCEQLFVGKIEVDGMPVLRMYEYERIRKVTYQMDFFLPEDSKFLLCRMRVVNPNHETTPMYWWSNIAVPELEKGRIVVDADTAYTNNTTSIYKTDIPIVNDIDISYPKRIPMAVDYFFDIPAQNRKYITQLNEDGYGMIQTSTNRLQSRKLFVWGQLPGSERWQEFLCEKAGSYIEIQAGLAKTQYGCIPMPADSEWEWLEAYGSIQVDKNFVDSDWNTLKKEVGKVLEKRLPAHSLEALLTETKETIALVPCHLISKGSIFGALENKRKQLLNASPLSHHLDFGEVPSDNLWFKLLSEGTLGTSSSTESLQSYMVDDTYYELLQKAILEKDVDNANTWYHLGLNHLVRNHFDEAIDTFKKSIQLSPTAFNYYALAAAYSFKGQHQYSTDNLLKAITLRPNDIGLLKDSLLFLLENKAYEVLLMTIEDLPTSLQENGRIQLYKAFAYMECGKPSLAEQILLENDGLEVEDIREGEDSISILWDKIQKTKETPINLPKQLDFRSVIY